MGKGSSEFVSRLCMHSLDQQCNTITKKYEEKIGYMADDVKILGKC